MYQSPFMSAMQNQFPGVNPYQLQRYDIIHVNGENGARAFRMAPNSQCLLLDDTSPIVWLCQSDGAGYHTVTPYTIAPYQRQQAPDYNSLNDRITRLEDYIKNEPYYADAKPAAEQPRANDAGISKVSAGNERKKSKADG